MKTESLIFSILTYAEIFLSDNVNIHGDPSGHCLANYMSQICLDMSKICSFHLTFIQHSDGL